MKRLYLLFTILFGLSAWPMGAQTIYQYESPDVKFIFFDKNISQYVPHLIWEHTQGLERHQMLWNGKNLNTYRPEQTFLYLTDWNDDGNGGVNVIPNNLIMVGMAPLSSHYDTSPSVERYRHLFSHELTHVFMTDKPTTKDAKWRKFFGAKVPTSSSSPITALWSYFTTPRWYNPRWYQEGIACFLETSMDGGVGRALGTYDEMYFRALVDGGAEIYSAVGLDAEGTSADFQMGATSYLYGTRFTNYLAYRYGADSLFRFYNRTEGSRRFFAAQFRDVFGKRLNDAWNDWRVFETQHQKENIATIEEYPLTELTPLYKQPMGSVGKPVYDPRTNRLYVAANYRGALAHISYLDLNTGKEKILSNIDGAMLYATSYLTLDTKRNRVIFTIHNSNIRGLDVIDANTGQRIKRLKLQRVMNITYDPTNDCMYGILSNAGVHHLVRYDAELENREVLYSFPFGQAVANLSVSHNGQTLLVQLTKPNGNEALVAFSVKGFEDAVLKYDEVMELDNVSLLNFTFAEDDASLIGSSNYTGVQNIWSIDLATKDMNLLTNVKTGIFTPIPYKKDSLIALAYSKDGMTPVKFEKKVLYDANSIPLLGQMALDRNPSLAYLSENLTEPNQSYGDIYKSIEVYHPIKEMRFAGAYPELTGYTDRLAFNNVTPVLGYSLLFRDPVGVSSISLRLGISPWSHNALKEQFHADFSWRYWGWTLHASYNTTDFYDLVGPMRRSRAGYNVGLSYQRQNTLYAPFRYSWYVAANAYGMMKELPLFQDIESPVTRLQTLSGSLEIANTRSTIGAVTAEQGYSLNVSAYSYFAALNGKYNAFPSLIFQANKGFLLPVGHNNSLWIRTALGQSFGRTDSSLGYQFFGGFRNNYVDNGSVLRYREVSAMPGARIDQIAAHSFAKITGELCFTPIRLKNVGWPGFYPGYAFFTLFSSDLLVNPWERAHSGLPFENYVNIGAQFNIEMVLFSYMKTTWSIGYATLFSPNGKPKGELMLSLKLL